MFNEIEVWQFLRAGAFFGFGVAALISVVCVKHYEFMEARKKK